MSLAESAPVPDHRLPGLTEPTRRGRSSRFIGDIVVDLGYATRESVEAAIAESRANGRRTGEVLV
jgi:type IV pilus assembly protein PilB